MHGVLWSLALNLLSLCTLSLARPPSSIERLQAELFVPDALTPMAPSFRRWRTTVTVQDIQNAWRNISAQNAPGTLSRPSPITRQSPLARTAPADFELLQHAEHLIASSIGAASSRLVMSLLLKKRTVSAKAALKLLDDSHAAFHFNREILQTALDHVRQGIAVFDADLHLICSNQQFGEILGLPPHLVQIGIPLTRFSRSWRRPTPPDIGEQRGLGGEAAGRLHRHERAAPGTSPRPPYGDRGALQPDAGRRAGDYLLRRHALFEAAEALERANATLEKRVHDRTEELTRLNSELALAKSTAEDANNSKTRFLAAASHDILQPLNAARLYVTSLVERQNGGEDSRLVENIDDSLEAIEEILGALLDISRLDAGAMTTSITSFKVGDLMRSLEIEFAPIARAKGFEADLRALFAAGRIRPAAAAAAVAEPDLQRHQIYARRAACWSAAGGAGNHCRSASTTPASEFRRSSAARSSRNFIGSNRERGSRAASGLGCRSSSGWHACSIMASPRLQCQRRLDVFGDGADRKGHQPYHRGDQRTPLSKTPMQRRADRLHRERSADPGRHEDAADGMGCRGHRRDRPGCCDRGDRDGRRKNDRAAGRLSSRPRQRHRRDPRHPPPFRRDHSGDPDHGRPQPAGSRRGERRRKSLSSTSRSNRHRCVRCSASGGSSRWSRRNNWNSAYALRPAAADSSAPRRWL